MSNVCGILSFEGEVDIDLFWIFNNVDMAWFVNVNYRKPESIFSFLLWLDGAEPVLSNFSTNTESKLWSKLILQYL